MTRFLRTLAVAALALAADPAVAARPVTATGANAPGLVVAQGAWIGGFDLGERRIPYILRLGDTAGSTTLDRIDATDRPFAPDSLAFVDDSIRVRFAGAGGAAWTFALRPSPTSLSGVLVMPRASGDLRFPASFRPMAVLTPTALRARAGDYEDAHGSRLHLSDDADGTLIAYRAAERNTRMLFPADAASFVGGPGPTRADSVVIELEFDGDVARWVQDGMTILYRRARPHRDAVTFSGDVLRLGSLEMAFSKIVPGTFEMGQRRSHAEIAAALELGPLPADLPEPEPLRKTTLTHGFRIARVEVTNGWFQAFVDETGHMTDPERAGYGLRWNGEGFDRVPGMTWREPGFDVADDFPVVHVSWYDADAFCRWLGARFGRTVRLPTEAEWQWACAAAARGLFAFGDGLADLDEYAWSNRNAKGPQPVGRKRPNASGLFDMHGNVWEWCGDGFVPLEAKAVTDPGGDPGNDNKVLRGGSWINGPYSLRSAFRGQDRASLAEPHIGFRVVIEDR